MSNLPDRTRSVRKRLDAVRHRLLPWSSRAELDQTAQSLRTEIETLGHRVNSLMQSGHATAIRWEHLDDHLARMSRDLTAMVGSHLTENASSHDQIARAHAVLQGELRATSDRLDMLLSGVAAQRNALHNALAWFPTWSALAPLDAEPLVSVVVPTRNRRSLLEVALASVARQTYANWEAVVVNDGSTDDTSEFLHHLSARDRRFRLIEADGLGCGGARQRGLEHANGEVIAYLDDDNLMSDGWLRAAVEVLGRQPEVWAVYGAQLREVDAAQPWLLLEPFDQLRLLEGNFIDIGAFAHRPIDGMSHRTDLQGLEDWDFVLSVSERHTPVPLPVIASVYLTRAYGRMTLGSDHSADEEFVRSSAVRRRLANAEFVDQALRTIAHEGPTSDARSSNAIATTDVEMLLNIVRSISQRRDGPIRILEWGIGQNTESIQSELSSLSFHWLRISRSVGDGGGSLDSAERHEAPFDASAVDPTRLREAVLASPRTEVRFDPDPSSDATRYVVLPSELDIQFDVIVIDGPAELECLRQARELVSATGLVLLHGRDPSWHDASVDEFGSWCPIGDGFWVGSTIETDFTDVIPIRALLRGIRRSHLHGGSTSHLLRETTGHTVEDRPPDRQAAE